MLISWMPLYDYIATFDLDEVIIPKEFKSVPEMIKDALHKNPDSDFIVANRKLFPDGYSKPEME